MIILDCEQLSDEWFLAHGTIPTASNFTKILSATGKASTQAEGYMRKLLDAWATGRVEEGYKSEWMERGSEVEAEARDWYEFHTGADVQQVGLVYRDETRLVACSPDGLIPGGGFECKCPAGSTHIGYLLDGKLPTKYIPQVQGSMYVTGRKWWDFLSYHPDYNTQLLIRVARDEQYIGLLHAALTKFIAKMLEKRKALADKGVRQLEDAA